MQAICGLFFSEVGCGGGDGTKLLQREGEKDFFCNGWIEEFLREDSKNA